LSSRFCSDEIAALDGVAALIDKGLIIVDEDAGNDDAQPRFRMLETIREFGLDELAAGSDAETVRNEHADYVLTATEHAETIYLRGEDTPWLARLVAEQDNIRSALAWLIERRDADRALRLSAAAVWLWFVRGQFSEGRDWIERILAAPWGDVRSVARCRALFAAGVLAHYQGDSARVPCVLTEAETLSREVGDRSSLARSLLLRGIAAEDEGRYAEAAPLVQEAMELFRELGDKLWTAQALVHQGIVAFGAEDLETAIARCEEGLAIYDTVGKKLGASVGISGALDTLSLIAMQQHRYEDALSLQRRSISMRFDLGDRRGVALSLAGFAAIATQMGDFERAVRLFGASQALQEAVGSSLAHPESDLYDAAMARARRNLTAARSAAAWDAGSSQSLEHSVNEAISETTVTKTITSRVDNGIAQRLTSRELEVLKLVAAGLSDKEIADALFISPRTVMRHVANLFTKIDVHSRAAAGAYARRHSLV